VYTVQASIQTGPNHKEQTGEDRQFSAAFQLGGLAFQYA